MTTLTHEKLQKNLSNLKKIGNPEPTKIQKGPTITNNDIFLFQTHNEIFNKKLDALAHLKNKDNLHLFSEDKSIKQNKRFFTLDNETIYNLCRQKKFCLYENFDENNKIKLCLDIDIKKQFITPDVDKVDLLNNIINQSINLVLEQLKKYNIKNPMITVLTSNRENKLSAHIVFVDVIFNDIIALKFFMAQLQSHLIDKNIIDLNIYRIGCLRLLWNSKFESSTNLEYYKSYNYEYIDDKKLFMDCLLTNIPEKHQLVNYITPKNVKIKKKKFTCASNKLNININRKINQPIESLKKYLNLLNIKRTDQYNTWLYIGMCLFNCNSTEKCFRLWDNWSKQSSFYDSKDYNATKWNSFKFSNLGIGTLKYLAKQDNPDLYDDLEYSLEKPLYKSIKFNESHIMDEKDNIKDEKNITAKIITSWMNEESINKKILAINSCYDSSKTCTVKKILNEFNPEKVLFASYRQTLTHELHGGFKDYGITSYLDPLYNPKRIICQLESLHKIIEDDNVDWNNNQMDNDLESDQNEDEDENENEQDSENNPLEYGVIKNISDIDTKVNEELNDIIIEENINYTKDEYPFIREYVEVPSYDLIVLDEIESILAHLRSSTIAEKEKTFNILYSLIRNAKKILALDGDFHNRSYEFLKEFSEVIVLKN